MGRDGYYVTMMKPILLGEAPAPSMKPGDKPFSSDSGRRLREYVGVADLEERFELRNLLPEFPGHGVKGARFPQLEARLRASLLLPELEGRIVLLAGKRLADAFRWYGDYFEEGRADPKGSRFWTSMLYTIPHPSGVNTWWNDPANRDRARAFFDTLNRRMHAIL